MSKDSFLYTGCENLEVMSGADNYNNFLISFVSNILKKGSKEKIKVLDFGAGSGTYADMLKSKHSLKIDCLEPDDKLQKILRSKNYKVFSDISKLPKNSFDLIYAYNVFEHIEDDHASLKELSKALKKGGRIIVYVPAFQVLFTSMDEKVGHYRRYRTDRLKSMAAESGLSIETLGYYDPLGFAATLFYRAIGSKEGNISSKALKLYDRAVFPVSKMMQPLTKQSFGKNALLIAEKK